MKYFTDTLKAERRAWAKAAFRRKPRCMASGRLLRISFPAVYEIHEICMRSHAPRRWCHPCNFLLLSSKAHEQLHDDNVPPEMQLAMKAICDLDHFDLDKWLALEPSLNPERITIEDVLAAAHELANLKAIWTLH